MGQMARMSRAERFCNAFDDRAANAVESYGIHDGITGDHEATTFTVQGFALEQDDREEVCLVMKVVDQHGATHTFTVEKYIFDPDYGPEEDQIEVWADQFDLSEDEVRARLTKADLD